MGKDSGKGGRRSSEDVTLTAMGLTLLGVVINVGVTVALGISGAWWLRAAVGLAVSITLGLLAAGSTSKGLGIVGRFAIWVVRGKH